jgi:purine-binding chemotaxis protein CheW
MGNINNDIQIIGFKLNSEEYALEISGVQEIIKVNSITRVPRSKQYILGVINLRGIVIPVIDLNIRFGNGKSSEIEKKRVIILKFGTLSVGIVVDGVSEVIDISASQILSNPTITTSINQEFLKGVCKLGDDRLLTLLDIEKTLEIKA